MNISVEKNQYIVPIRFVGIEELGIVDLKDEDFYARTTETCIKTQGMSLRRYYENCIEDKIANDKLDEGVKDESKVISLEHLSMIKHNIKKQIEYKFLKVRDIAKCMTPGQILEMHINQFKDMFKAYIDNIPCLTSIKEKSINGMTFDELLEIHIGKFKRIYDFHYNEFKCEEMNGVKIRKVSEASLEVKIKQMAMETEAIFKNIAKLLDGLSLDQKFQVVEVVLITIMECHIENVACFKRATSKSINGMSMQELINMHKIKIENIFNDHVELLSCDK
ncbi:MAG: hypothetical protein RR891_05555 [Clostridium sp.]|uniref:hypothetical protein n=1 Tax=Clostridium sp. TaxID=1506 RepID=UPI00302BCF05